MAPAEIDRTLSRAVKDLIAMNRVHAAPTADREAQRARWNGFLEGQLTEWERNPALLAEDGLEAPSPSTIALARQVGGALRDNGWEPPQRVAPDGEGAIVFEPGNGPIFESVAIQADGMVELTIFCDGRLTARHRLNGASEEFAPWAIGPTL